MKETNKMLTAVRVKRSKRSQMRDYLNTRKLAHDEVKELMSVQFVVKCPTDSHMYEVERYARGL